MFISFIAERFTIYCNAPSIKEGKVTAIAIATAIATAVVIVTKIVTEIVIAIVAALKIVTTIVILDKRGGIVF